MPCRVVPARPSRPACVPVTWHQKTSPSAPHATDSRHRQETNQPRATHTGARTYVRAQPGNRRRLGGPVQQKRLQKTGSLGDSSRSGKLYSVERYELSCSRCQKPHLFRDTRETNRQIRREHSNLLPHGSTKRRGPLDPLIHQRRSGRRDGNGGQPLRDAVVEYVPGAALLVKQSFATRCVAYTVRLIAAVQAGRRR